ncbi:hypothetical protein [Staphylococcus sp. 17KM0847]|uniref:hypothetical protein n=1 Tax=Staphylococcus sp. 17KM0847 TaxID=2583989 RepID=UPI0015DBED96|nr:hypothetical protein [Staphylococcus sp. 17KM0847]QLK86887.1 hypothetical protein FGL66_09355 [Staphylococcus sp. 17KM0847]
MEIFLDEVLDINNLEMSDELFEVFLERMGIKLVEDKASAYRKNVDTLLNEKDREINITCTLNHDITPNSQRGVAA